MSPPRTGRRCCRSPALAVALLLALLLAGCGGDPATPGIMGNRVIGYAPVVASGVTAAQWPWFFDDALALGPPGGTLDVVSLGYDPTQASALGGSLTLGLGTAGDATARACAVDGPGDDLAVYENAFVTTNPATSLAGTYTEVATVEVSADNNTWYLFPPTDDTAMDPVGPARYANLAGVTPTDQGGDRFDLAALIAAHGLPADFRACYVRLTDGGTLYPDYGNSQSDLYDSGADIDAVEALNSVDAPGLTP